MQAFDAYSHALASLGGFALLVIVLSALSTLGRNSENRTASGAVKRDYDDVVYRRGRAFMNAVEVGTPFVAATLGAILVGASPLLVNLLASLFLLARIATAFVHIRTTNQTLRSATWAVGVLCIVVLAALTILGAVT